MYDQHLTAFLFVSILLTITPGADTILVLRNVLRGGRKEGIGTTLGIGSGLFVHAMLSAVGVSIILMHYAQLFTVIKTLGAIYLIWLGWQSLRSSFGESVMLVEGGDNNRKHRSVMGSFLEGMLNNILNPKVAVFYLAFLPQFIGPAEPVLAKSILLAGIHCSLVIVWLSGVSVFLDTFRDTVIKPAVQKILNRICGSLLIGLGIRLAFDD